MKLNYSLRPLPDGRGSDGALSGACFQAFLVDHHELAQVLYILCRSDALFPPKIAPGVMQALNEAGVEARYFEIDSDLGHSSSGPEHAKWSPVLREFLAPLVARVS